MRANSRVLKKQVLVLNFDNKCWPKNFHLKYFPKIISTYQILNFSTHLFITCRVERQMIRVLACSMYTELGTDKAEVKPPRFIYIFRFHTYLSKERLALQTRFGKSFPGRCIDGRLFCCRCCCFLGSSCSCRWRLLTCIGRLRTLENKNMVVMRDLFVLLVKSDHWWFPVKPKQNRIDKQIISTKLESTHNLTLCYFNS